MPTGNNPVVLINSTEHVETLFIALILLTKGVFEVLGFLKLEFR